MPAQHSPFLNVALNVVLAPHTSSAFAVFECRIECSVSSTFQSDIQKRRMSRWMLCQVNIPVRHSPSMGIKGQGQIQFKNLGGVVPNAVLSWYEDNPLNNKVIANNSIKFHWNPVRNCCEKAGKRSLFFKYNAFLIRGNYSEWNSPTPTCKWYVHLSVLNPSTKFHFNPVISCWEIAGHESRTARRMAGWITRNNSPFPEFHRRRIKTSKTNYKGPISAVLILPQTLNTIYL